MRGYRSSLITRTTVYSLLFQLRARGTIESTFPSKSIPSMLVKVKVDSNKIKDALRNGLDF